MARRSPAVWRRFLQARSGCLQIGMAACVTRLATDATWASAHAGQPLAPHDLWWAWSWDPVVCLLLLFSGWLYGHGISRLWRRAGVGRGVRQWQAAAFVGGWVTLVLALVSALDRLGAVLFSAHMVQHTLLMLLAAPLFVLGRPLIPFLWGLPMPWRRRINRWWGPGRGVRRTWRMLSDPRVAWILQTAALWGWHAPGPYQAALASSTVHALQHLSFLGSAMLFWWALVYGKHGRRAYGIAVLAVFTTAVQSSILGALLTFAPAPWYPAYIEATAAWGLNPLQDQQLAGLVMWVPAGGLYTLASLAFLALWLQEGERRTQQREARLGFNAQLRDGD